LKPEEGQASIDRVGWDNRLVLKDLPFGEACVVGRIAIALVVDEGCGSGFDRSAGLIPAAADAIDRARTEGRRIVFLLLADSDDNIVGGSDCRNEESVLVHSVELVQGPDASVPVISFYGFIISAITAANSGATASFRL
jgi:hypothetical protein